MILGIASGINLFLQSKQDQVTRLMGAKAGNFNVIAKQVRILRHLVHRSAEKLLLIIKTWAPGQVRANLQVLTHAMANHVLGMDSFRGFDVVSAARRMDVMVSRPPAELGGIDPSLQLKGKGLRFPCELKVLLPGEILGPARVFDRVISLG